MSSASTRCTAALSCSLTTRGQSFSIRVSSASIAALSGVGAGVATVTVEGAFAFGWAAQPNNPSTQNPLATTITKVEIFFITRTPLNNPKPCQTIVSSSANRKWSQQSLACSGLLITPIDCNRGLAYCDLLT